MRVKRWAYVYDIDLFYGFEPCYEGNTADHVNDPVGIYMGLTFAKPPPVGVTTYKDMGHGPKLVNIIPKNVYIRQIWVQWP